MSRRQCSETSSGDTSTSAHSEGHERHTASVLIPVAVIGVFVGRWSGIGNRDTLGTCRTLTSSTARPPSALARESALHGP